MLLFVKLWALQVECAFFFFIAIQTLTFPGLLSILAVPWWCSQLASGSLMFSLELNNRINKLLLVCKELLDKSFFFYISFFQSFILSLDMRVFSGILFMFMLFQQTSVVRAALCLSFPSLCLRFSCAEFFRYEYAPTCPTCNLGSSVQFHEQSRSSSSAFCFWNGRGSCERCLDALLCEGFKLVQHRLKVFLQFFFWGGWLTRTQFFTEEELVQRDVVKSAMASWRDCI